ncbi:MAG: Exonuclease [Akkermansiaceae bacterium]|nr:Exonuclease [Akkermansiaceae bacterium]
MPQRSPEWFAARRGVITASEIGPFVFNAGKVAETARQNLIDTKLGESADGDDCPPSYEDYWMKRGTLREPEAIEAFSVHTGEETKQVGFILHDSGLLGCSPDGFEVGLEMKCPSGKIQIKRLREAVLPDEYRCQVHASMIVTGADEWHFWSWHPNIPPFHVLVKRDDFTRQLEDGLLALAAELKRQQEDLSAVWNAYFGSEVAA